jgi:hypothetical protein
MIDDDPDIPRGCDSGDTLRDHVAEEGDDPLLCAILSFVDREIAGHPTFATALSRRDAQRTAELVDGVVVDDDETFPDDFELPQHPGSSGRRKDQPRYRPDVVRRMLRVVDCDIRYSPNLRLPCAPATPPSRKRASPA